MMKKKICVVILVVLLVATTASAHPGRTDASGGHHNRSTGEYHYHHGYSAHDHYDMDGNGTIDCPYNFNKKSNDKVSTTTKNTEPTASAVQENTVTEKGKVTLADVVGVVLGVVLCLPAI